MAQVLVDIILLFVVVRSKSFLVETKAEDDAANIQDSVKNRRMDPSRGIVHSALLFLSWSCMQKKWVRFKCFAVF